MQIFVKMPCDRTLVVDVSAATLVEDVKALVGAAPSAHLVSDKLLVEGSTLGDYNIAAEATVSVVLAVDGGKKKKKKKKIFKGPKKHAHRHKNVAMRVLKYYKVEGDGQDAEYKVTHLRIECPHPDCGAGVFMAQHKDRQTCGKCALTYVAQKK